MQKSVISIVIIALLVIGVIVWYGGSSKDQITPEDLTATTTSSVSVSETTKVSGQLSEYQNAELGFLVKYPNSWEREESNAGVNFVIPIDQNQVSTVATLQANVQVLPGTCAFPPVTTVKDRETIKHGDLSFSMISMSNTVQGRNYFNRMYSLQKDQICYMFSFSSITQSGASKNLTGSSLTQAENNNKAIINTADTAFANMVKSFSFVTGPQGQDETKVVPTQ